MAWPQLALVGLLILLLPGAAPAEEAAGPTRKARLPRTPKTSVLAGADLENQLNKTLLALKPIKQVTLQSNLDFSRPALTLILDTNGKKLNPTQKDTILFLVGQLVPGIPAQNIYLIDERGYPLLPLAPAVDPLTAALGQLTSALTSGFYFMLVSQSILLLFLTFNFFILRRFTRRLRDLASAEAITSEVPAPEDVSSRPKRYGLAAGLRNQLAFRSKAVAPSPVAAARPPSAEQPSPNLEEKLANLTPKQIYTLMADEKPSTIAFILSFLEPPSEELVIDHYPPAVQEDIRGEFPRLGTVDAEIIRATQKILDSKETPRQTSPSAPAGADAERPDSLPLPGLEEILFLPDWMWRTALAQITPQLAALSLKTSSSELTKKIFRNLPPQWRELVTAELNLAGVVLLKEVDQAQQQLVEKILTLRYNPATASHAD